MSQNQSSEPQGSVTGSQPPTNPLANGKTGKTSVLFAVLGALAVVVLFTADTIQFVFTGHESQLLTVIGKDLGGVSLVGIAGSLLSSYLSRRKQ